MSIYEKLAKVRDMVSLEEDPILWEHRAYPLGQIAEMAFTNESRKDEVPNSLLIEDCHLEEDELRELLSQLDLKVEFLNIYEQTEEIRTYDIYLET